VRKTAVINEDLRNWWTWWSKTKGTQLENNKKGRKKERCPRPGKKTQALTVKIFCAKKTKTMGNSRHRRKIPVLTLDRQESKKGQARTRPGKRSKATAAAETSCCNPKTKNNQKGRNWGKTSLRKKSSVQRKRGKEPNRTPACKAKEKEAKWRPQKQGPTTIRTVKQGTEDSTQEEFRTSKN